MRIQRKLVAPLSAAFLILVAVLAFTNLHAGTEYPPPILDPEFDLWVSDTDLGGRKPLVWELEYVKGAGDKVVLQQATLADKKALGIRVFQDGADDRWAYVYLTQTIDGTRLRALFSKVIGVSVFFEPPCECGALSSSRSTVFGIETNDGIHTLTFVFSGERTEMQQSLAHRIIFFPTVAGKWSYHEIDVAAEYLNAEWKPPDRLSFSVILGAPGSAAGWHAGYLHRFSVTSKTTTRSAQNEKLEMIDLLVPRPQAEVQESQRFNE